MQNRGSNRYIVRYVFVWIGVLLSLLNASEVTATLSTPEAVKGSRVTLQLEAVGEGRVEFPSIRKIGDTPIVGQHQSQSSSFTSINGKQESRHSTRLSLSFIPQHDMQIPSYRVSIGGKVYQSQPLHLRVVQSAKAQSSSPAFSLLMRSTKHRVVVGESLIVKVLFSLKNGVRLSQTPQYTKPNFQGFFVQEIEEQKQYHNGGYQITELSYILVPKQEGNFTLSPAGIKVALLDQSRRNFFGQFVGASWREAHSNTLAIEVLPTPSTPDSVGDFTLEATLDTREVKVNTPVNLTVTLKGRGVIESLEWLEMEIDGVTIYSDEDTVKHTVVDGAVESVATKRFVFISDHNFTIPSVKIESYNPLTKQMKLLELPAYPILVKGGVAATVQPKQTERTLPQKTEPTTPHTASVVSVEEQGVAWWILLVTFGLGVGVGGVMVRWFPRWNRKKEWYTGRDSDALQILSGHLGKDREIEEMVRLLYARRQGDKSIKIDKKRLQALLNRVTTPHR